MVECVIVSLRLVLKVIYFNLRVTESECQMSKVRESVKGSHSLMDFGQDSMTVK